MANVEGSSVKVPTLVKNLHFDVLERLGMKMNYRMPMKDFRTLAGKMKYTYEAVKNFERHANPTAALLMQWSHSGSRGRGKVGEEKTVTDLIQLLSLMGREDAVDLMSQYEFTEMVIPSPNGRRYQPPPPRALSPFGDYSQDVVSTVPRDHYQGGYGWVADSLAKEHEEDQGINNYSPNTIVSGFQHSMYHSYFSPPADPLPQVPRHPATMETENGNGVRHHEAPSPTDPRPSCSYRNQEPYSSLRHTPSEADRAARQKQAPRPNSMSAARHKQAPSPNSMIGSRNEAPRPVNVIDRRNEVPRPINSIEPHQGSNTVTVGPPPVMRPVVTDKVALVIGNKEYECDKLKGLFYPERDAQDVADQLWSLGFKVVSLVNLTLSEMRTAVLSFCRLLGRGVYGVLYYAGHGYEDGGENFLLPVDADLRYNREDSLRAQEILQTMQECDTELNLLIIDSCRIRLPEKGGRVAYTRRGVRGNNIFAYSCCSQQEAYEEPGKKNGLYAQHLLRHIRRDARIEIILMDVARDVALTNCRLNQRPCHESDAVLECRLTDPIQANILPDEYRERVDLWRKAHTIPQAKRVLERDGLTVDFCFKASFSNVLQILVEVINHNSFQLKDFVMDLQVQSPVKSQVKSLSNTDVPGSRGVFKQVVKLSALQKLQDPLSSTLKLYYSVGDEMIDIEEKVSLGCPLVASVFVLWDWWISCGRLPGIKCTQV